LRAPLRLVQLSDLHYSRWHGPRAVRAWVAAAMAAQPDLIVLTGDLVDGATEAAELELFVAELARLRAPLGVFACWGNHDYEMNDNAVGLAGFEALLRAAGLRLLVNANQRLRPDLVLAAVDDLWRGQANSNLALAGIDPDGQQATLLLSHNPDVLPDVPVWLALTLCGHTHGGQIKIPGFGPFKTASRYGTRFAEGFVEAPALGFVSRGLGTSIAPVRLFCPAEVVVFDLLPLGIA
jgi:uncharacterized protein